MKHSMPLMVGVMSLGLLSGGTAALLTQHAFAAAEPAVDFAVSTSNTTKEANIQSIVEDEERAAHREAMKALHDSAVAALKSGDFEAWNTAMTTINETRYQEMKSALTQENFDIMKKIEEARANEDHETMRELASELDMPLMGMGGLGMHRGGPGGVGFKHRVQ